MIPSPVKYEGLIKVTQSEKYSPIWVSDTGLEFIRNDFGTFTQISYPVVISNDNPSTVMTRNHSDFNSLKSYEVKRAISVFNSNSIQGLDNGFIPSPEKGIDHREQTLQKLDWHKAN